MKCPVHGCSQYLDDPKWCKCCLGTHIYRCVYHGEFILRDGQWLRLLRESVRVTDVLENPPR